VRKRKYIEEKSNGPILKTERLGLMCHTDTCRLILIDIDTYWTLSFKAGSGNAVTDTGEFLECWYLPNFEHKEIELIPSMKVLI